MNNYRRVLWIALVINAAMFFVEIIFGKISASVSLLADAIDFFGDATNYALSLWALGKTSNPPLCNWATLLPIAA